MARAIAIVAAIAAGAATACSGPGGSPRPPSADVRYVDWSVGLVWRLDDLPAVFAAFDRLCDRADSGDESARAEVAAAGPDLWLIRERLLPLLRSLPGASGVPGEAAVAGRCRPEPDAALVDVVAALGDDPAAWPGSAGPILEFEASHEGGRGLADEARVARVVVAVGPFASGPPGPSPALAASVALLECPPCSAPRDPHVRGRHQGAARVGARPRTPRDARPPQARPLRRSGFQRPPAGVGRRAPGRRRGRHESVAPTPSRVLPFPPWSQGRPATRPEPKGRRMTCGPPPVALTARYE